MILALDTASKAGSIALVRDHQLIFSANLNTGYTHSKTLMPLMAQMFELSGEDIENVTGVAVSAGPGSFTGIRIGFATAKALAYALQVDFFAVPTLEALAMNGRHSKGLICPILDARRQEVYTAIYEDGEDGLQPLHEADAMPLSMLMETLQGYQQPIYFTGDGLDTYQATLKETFPHAVFATSNERIVQAVHVAELAQKRVADDLYQAKPHYIRRSEAVIKWEAAHPGETLHV